MNKKWRKGLAMGLCIVAIANSMSGSSINAATKNMDEKETIKNLENLDSVKEVKTIDQTDLPENVIPLKFDSIEEAKKYIELEEENPDYVISSETLYECYDIENNVIDLSGIDVEDEMIPENEQSLNLSEMISSANTQLATCKKNFGLGKLHIDVEYTERSGKFKSIKNINSYITGITIGNSWEQQSTSKSITNNGKKMNVTVKGVVTHYILLDIGLTEICSESKTYSASWNYDNGGSVGHF